MVTYSDLFTFVIMICAIITLVRSVRNDTHDKTKKITVQLLRKVDGYFRNL